MVMLFHACLTHLSVVSLVLSVPSCPPADTANVLLRALSFPSPHTLKQTGSKTLLLLIYMLHRENSQSCFYDFYILSVGGLILFMSVWLYHDSQSSKSKTIAIFTVETPNTNMNLKMSILCLKSRSNSNNINLY